MFRPLVFVLLLVLAASCGPGKKDKTKGPSLSPAKPFTCPSVYPLDTLVHDVMQAGGLDDAAYCRFLKTLDSLAQSVKEASGPYGDPIQIVESLKKTIYGDGHMVFDSNALVPDNALPRSSYERKRGGCLGVSFLFLMLGERLDLPLHGVMLPGHFFVRYDDGKTRFNIEPNRSGFSHPDSYYVRRYGTQTRPFYDMRNLTEREAAAALAYGLGASLLHEKWHAPSARLFRLALNGLPGYPEALGNLGLALAGMGRFDSAAAILRSAEPLFPEDERAPLNLGAVYERMGMIDSARAVYERGLIRLPESQGITRALKRVGER